MGSVPLKAARRQDYQPSAGGIWVSPVVVWKREELFLRAFEVSYSALPGTSKALPCTYSGTVCMAMVHVCVGVVVLNPGRQLQATCLLGSLGDIVGSGKSLHPLWARGVRRPLWTWSQVGQSL